MRKIKAKLTGVVIAIIIIALIIPIQVLGANEEEVQVVLSNDGEVIKSLDLTHDLDEEKVREVETTSSRIKTSIISEVIQNEEVDGVQKKVTVGGLKIENEDNATYYYTITKLPNEQYSELMNLALKLQKEEFENLSINEKIETEKEFYDLYENLKGKQQWIETKDMKILQPEDSENGDKYVVFLKSVKEDGTETIDVKFMVSNREDDEGKDQIETTRTVKETTKLPITGDSFILFIIFAIIVLAAVIVFIRMKKLQNQKDKK